MSGILMSGCYDFFLIKWIANILGFVMGGLYNFFGIFGIFNIGLCIIVFTIICKMVLFPITLKQQKYTKVSSKMAPELQAIQKKYQGKRDNDSMMKQQAETMALYDKYGTSPSGSCLPMFIQMFILLALYAVIISIPTYVKPVSEIYTGISEEIVSVFDDYNELNNVNTIVDKENEDFSKLINNNYNSDDEEKVNKDRIYENLINLNATIKPLNDFETGYDNSLKIIEELEKVSDEKWDELISTENKKEKPSEYNISILEKYKEYEEVDWNVLKSNLDQVKNNIEEKKNDISDIYTFATIDLSKSPSEDTWIALIIPILSFLTQWLSMKISTSNQAGMEGNPMASSMKMMSFAMPLISAFFCYSLPSGLGLYWVMSAVVQIVQQVLINHHFKDVDVDEIIKNNIEKQKKKKERKGIVDDGNKISAAATYNAKNIKVDSSKLNSADVTDEYYNYNNEAPKTYEKGSIAQRANMVKEFNERNNK